MVEPMFADPHVARVYDHLEPDRDDLDLYAALVDECGARSVLDVGCGTGTFASRLASAGVAGQLVSFRWTYLFERSDETITSDSTLRFRGRQEIGASLVDAGFRLLDVRDAPDRPGLELVLVAQRTD